MARTSEISGGVGETKGVIGGKFRGEINKIGLRGRAGRTVAELDWTLAWFWFLIVNVRLEGLMERLRE